MKNKVNDDDIAHIELPQEVKLATILDSTERELYTYFRKSIQDETDSIKALDAIRFRLKRLLIREDLAPYAEAIWDKDIIGSTKDTLQSIKEFFVDYTTEELSADDFFNDISYLIKELNKKSSKIKKVIKYLDKKVASLDSAAYLSTLLRDVRIMTMTAEWFVDHYKQTIIGDPKVYEFLDIEKEHILERIEYHKPHSPVEWTVLESQVLWFYDALPTDINHEDMLFILLFSYRYQILLTALQNLYKLYDTVRDFSSNKEIYADDKEELKKFKKDYEATTGYYNNYSALTNKHKKSPYYREDIDNKIDVFYTDICEQIEEEIQRIKTDKQET